MEETLPQTFKTAAQNGYKKPDADPMSFACLPDTLASDLGGPIGPQGLRWRVLLLAHALGRAKAQVGKQRTVEYYSRDASCEVAEEEFVYTMVSAAEDFYARLAGADRSPTTCPLQSPLVAPTGPLPARRESTTAQMP